MCRERRAFGRRRNARAVLPPRAILGDPATAELAAILGGVAVSGAALYGLALAIRDANGFDERDERLMAERMGLKVEGATPAGAIAGLVEAATEVQVEPRVEKQDEIKKEELVLPDAELEARVTQVQAWIGAWKDKSAQLAVEAERRAEQAEEKAMEAEKRVREAEKELARAEAEEGMKERVAHVRAWIDSWKDARKTAKESQEKAMEAQQRVIEAEKEQAKEEAEEERKERVAHVRAWIDSWREGSAKRGGTPSLDPNPGMAAAMIKEMTEDTPVGVQRNAAVEEKAPAMVSATREDSSSGVTKETEAAPRQRRVSITSEYETKINSLLSNYNVSQEKKKNMLPRETVTVNQEEMAAAEKEQAIKNANPIVLFFFRIIAMIQACFAFIKSLITGNGGSDGPSTVAA